MYTYFYKGGKCHQTLPPPPPKMVGVYNIHILGVVQHVTQMIYFCCI